MYNFRMLNRRPLALPALDTLVPMVAVAYQPFTASQAMAELRRMPNLLYNKYSGWHFFLSRKAIGKLRYETYPVHTAELLTIHLSAVANIDTLIQHAVLGYSKPESDTRLNSNRKEVDQNVDIKAIHRFYVGAWINEKPYSVRLTIREYLDGRAELGEEAKAYALHLKEMKAGVTGQFSESPASHGLTTALGYAPLIKDDISGISAPSSRCEPAPPTDASLTNAKIGILIESNLKEGEESLFQQRAAFDYSQTGTDRIETIFDRLRLTDEERQRLYAGEEITVHNIKIRANKIDATLSFRDGELILSPMD